MIPLIVSCVPTIPLGPLGSCTMSHLNLPAIWASPGTNCPVQPVCFRAMRPLANSSSALKPVPKVGAVSRQTFCIHLMASWAGAWSRVSFSPLAS